MLLHYDEYVSPIGRILFASDGKAVCMLDYEGYEKRMSSLLARRFGNVDFERPSDPLGLKHLLDNYFAGDLHAFDAIPVRMGGTGFQESVWTALRTIPAGETWSYGELAKKLTKSRRHYRALSPRHRSLLGAHRLRRRTRAKAMAAGSRTGAVRRLVNRVRDRIDSDSGLIPAC
jgi:O6-methylguanine-DNA--protein-cysteine methyltransferase